VVISSPTSTAGYSQASRYPLELGATEGALRQLPATAIPGVALFELADGAVKLCKALPDGSIATEFDVKTQEVTFAQPAASATWWSKSSPICQHETKMLERITKVIPNANFIHHGSYCFRRSKVRRQISRPLKHPRRLRKI
jgi:hypothetical protein